MHGLVMATIGCALLAGGFFGPRRSGAYRDGQPVSVSRALFYLAGVLFIGLAIASFAGVMKSK